MPVPRAPVDSLLHKAKIPIQDNLKVDAEKFHTHVSNKTNVQRFFFYYNYLQLS